MPLPVLLSYSLNFVAGAKYFLVFLGTLLEGPLVMIFSGFLYRLGWFALVPLYFALVLGDLVADVFWYYIGCYFAEPIIMKGGKFFGVTPEVFNKFKKLMHDKQTFILLGSKVTIGFGMALATVIAAGASKVPFKKFLFLNTVGEFFLAGWLLLLGYLFGHLYVYINDTFKVAFIIGGAIICITLTYGFSRFIKFKALELDDTVNPS